MARKILTNPIWEQCRLALRQLKDRRGTKPTLPDREFMEAVLYLARTGTPWRDLPPEFGTWSAVYMRFRRWEDNGLWQRLWALLEQGACPVLLQVFIDSTSIPVHPHAAGAPKKTVAERLWAARGED